MVMLLHNNRFKAKKTFFFSWQPSVSNKQQGNRSETFLTDMSSDGDHGSELFLLIIKKMCE